MAVTHYFLKDDKLAPVLETRFSGPTKHLEPFVRFYVQRKVEIRGEPIIHPVPARAVSMIVFDLAEQTEVYLYPQSRTIKAPPAIVVGPQSYRRTDMRLHGAQESFAVMFQAAALHQLFSTPIHELSNKDGEAHAVLGQCASRLWQRLGETESFEERVRLVDEWLSHQFLRLRHVDPVALASNQILASGGRVNIRSLAQKTGLSLRQFERRFTQNVGFRPKLFARIARFEAALENKARFSAKSWTDVAHEFGYYDQTHMNHDFADFTGETPTETLNHLTRVFSEQIKAVRSQKCAEEPARDSGLML